MVELIAEPGPSFPPSPESFLPVLCTQALEGSQAQHQPYGAFLPKALGALELDWLPGGRASCWETSGWSTKGQAEAPAGSWARTPPGPCPDATTPHPCPYPTCTQILIGASFGGPDLKQWLHQATSEQSQRKRSASTDPNRAQTLSPASQSSSLHPSTSPHAGGWPPYGENLQEEDSWDIQPLPVTTSLGAKLLFT